VGAAPLSSSREASKGGEGRLSPVASPVAVTGGDGVEKGNPPSPCAPLEWIIFYQLTPARWAVEIWRLATGIHHPGPTHSLTQLTHLLTYNQKLSSLHHSSSTHLQLDESTTVLEKQNGKSQGWLPTCWCVEGVTTSLGGGWLGREREREREREMEG
jgi:hypothetical protein